MSIRFPVDLRVTLCMALFFVSVSAYAQQASLGSPLAVPAVPVNATSPEEGTAAVGYQPQTATTTGPWGPAGIIDTPYSINVVSDELIENTIASRTDQIFEHDPLTQLNLNQSRGYGSIIYIRGLRLDSGFTELNGLRVSGDLIMPVEDKDRVEVLSGLSGFLYGPGNAGGLVNYVMKKPTASRLIDVTVGNYGGGQYFAHADLGGPMADGRFGYRVNLVASDGDSPISRNHIEKWLASGVFDWHVTDQALLEFQYSHQHYYETGTQADWGSFGGSFAHFDPNILDPFRNYSQTWTFNRNDLDMGNVNFSYSINSHLNLRLAYQLFEIADANVYTGNNINYDAGEYTYFLAAVSNAPMRHRNSTGYGFLDWSFNTGPVSHKVTTGFYGDDYRLRTHQDNFGFVGLDTYAVSRYPQYAAAPSFGIGELPFFTEESTLNRNWVIGDDLRAGDHWSALLGASRAEIDTQNFNPDGSSSSSYNKTATTPNASLLYKFTPWLTAYVTYIESLVNSGTAATTFDDQPVVNGNQAISPSLSKEYEAGLKLNVGGSLVTAAVFNLNVANTYYESFNGGATYTYTNDGRQTDRGVELTTTGRILPDLTLVGGIVLLDAKITRTNTPYLEDQPPYGAARQMGKLFAEYDLPWVQGLTLSGGVNYVGRQLANEYAYPNPDAAEWLPSFTTFDLGARFTTELRGLPAVFRLAATNVANRSYWQQAEVTGAPRTIAFSITGKFH